MTAIDAAFQKYKQFVLAAHVAEVTPAERERAEARARQAVIDALVVALPGALETSLAEWAVGADGRADDAMVYLTTADKKHVGYLTLGWFRQHTTLADAERDLQEDEESQDRTHT